MRISKILVQLVIACTIADGLKTIRPGAEWTLTGDTYAGLTWIDTIQTKPTLQEIQTAQTDCLATLTPAGILAGQRMAAIDELNVNPSGNAKIIRAVFLVAMDEINILRERDVDRAADTEAATTLANLKTRWAARTLLQDRTITQFENAVINKINSGEAD